MGNCGHQARCRCPGCDGLLRSERWKAAAAAELSFSCAPILASLRWEGAEAGGIWRCPGCRAAGGLVRPPASLRSAAGKVRSCCGLCRVGSAPAPLEAAVWSLLVVVAELRAEGAGGSAARLSNAALHRGWEVSFFGCVFFLLSTYPIFFARLETKKRRKYFF